MVFICQPFQLSGELVCPCIPHPEQIPSSCQAAIVQGKLINYSMKFFWKIFTWNKDLFVMHTVFLDIQSLYSLIGWICVSMYFSAKNTFCLFFFLIVHKIQIWNFWLILVTLAKDDIWDRIYIIIVVAQVFFSIGF